MTFAGELAGRRVASSGRRNPANRTLSPSSVASTRFIAGVPMKAATKTLSGLSYRRWGAVALEHAALVDHGDPVPERHCLRLIVGDVDRRDAEARVQLREGGAHPHAKLRVEVREGLVHQESLRLAHDRPAHRHPLTLAAGELRRAPVEQLLQAEQLRDLLDPARRLGLPCAPDLQAVADVLPHAHVRVERVALEDHRYVPAAGREVGDIGPADRRSGPR